MTSQTHLEYSWYDEATGTYELSIDHGGDDSAIAKIALAVAEIRDTDPLQMRPLYETIDPDVLDRLLEHDGHGSDRVTLTFPFEGFDITLHGNGRARIVPQT